MLLTFCSQYCAAKSTTLLWLNQHPLACRRESTEMLKRELLELSQLLINSTAKGKEGSCRSITCIIYLYSHIYVHIYACRVYVIKQLLMTHTSVLGVPSRPVLSVSSLPQSGSLSPSCWVLQADGRQLLFSTVFPHLCQPPRGAI